MCDERDRYGAAGTFMNSPEEAQRDKETVLFTKLISFKT